MVQECYKYVDEVSDLAIKLRLIDTLRTVTAGKVGVGFQYKFLLPFLEVKRYGTALALAWKYVLSFLIFQRTGKLKIPYHAFLRVNNCIWGYY
jgi:hypothetical protein